MGKYDDIINLPHHISPNRPHLTMEQRAAQFAAFQALTGYEDAIDKEAKGEEDKYDALGRIKVNSAKEEN